MEENFEEGLKALKYTFEKLVSNKSFIAYYLKKQQEKYRLSQNDLMKKLGIKKTRDFYKLGICKFPEVIMQPKSKEDFFETKVKEIADYIGCSNIALEFILIAN